MKKSDVSYWLFLGFLVFVGLRVSVEAALALLCVAIWITVTLLWAFEDQTGIKFMTAITMMRMLKAQSKQVNKETGHAEA